MLLHSKKCYNRVTNYSIRKIVGQPEQSVADKDTSRDYSIRKIVGQPEHNPSVAF